MTIVSKIMVTLDERVRTWTAVLAAAGWAEKEQAHTPHGVHLQSKALSQHLHEQSGLTDLPLVQEIGKSLMVAPELAELLAYVLVQLQAGRLAGFAAQADLAGLWVDHTAVWDEAVAHLTEIVDDAPVLDFCAKLMPEGKQLPL